MFGKNKTEEPDLTFEEFKAHAKTAIDQRLALARLVATEKASQLGAKVAFLAMTFLLFVFTLGFLSLAAGLWLSQVLGSALKGFGLLAGIYMFLLFLFYFIGKKSLVPILINRIISSTYDDDVDDEDDDEEEEAAAAELKSDVSHIAGVGGAHDAVVTPTADTRLHDTALADMDADRIEPTDADAVSTMHLPEKPLTDAEDDYTIKATPNIA